MTPERILNQLIRRTYDPYQSKQERDPHIEKEDVRIRWGSCSKIPLDNCFSAIVVTIVVNFCAFRVSFDLDRRIQGARRNERKNCARSGATPFWCGRCPFGRCRRHVAHGQYRGRFGTESLGSHGSFPYSSSSTSQSSSSSSSAALDASSANGHPRRA